RSSSEFGADYEATLVSLETGFFFQPVSGVYTGFKNSYTHNYIGDLKRDRIVNVMQSILYFKPSTYHLLALRTVSSFAWRHKANYRTVLGGDNGLRGYPDRYFNGTRLALVNTEYRVFSPIEILTVGLGGALFFDAGYIWDEHEKIGLSDLRSNIGLGLRFGLTKSSTARIIRLDVARALSDDNWFISFGTENLFSLARFQ
ncbi:MAG: BamA/TamA family outer membrane protein, partial [candidate division Zixibacteria bacterium]|nr:BamA/TamA family outer membrane protein [candidate division Zixibacteria bacterium]